MTLPSRSAELFDRLLSENPFTDNRVNAPSDEGVDVADLNRTAFERLTGLAREALVEHRGIGAMLWGEAGVGKSHLLSRLDRWARSAGACSVYLHNLLAAPVNVPRVLLRNVLGKLTWTDSASYRRTMLFEMITTAITRAIGETAGFRPWSELRQTLLNVLVGSEPAGPADAGLADQTVVDVLFRFFRSVLRRAQGKEDGTAATLAVQWLRGESVPAAQGHALLGLPAARNGDGPVLIDDPQQVKQVLVALTRLVAACGRPFILAFDQVDNLEDQQVAALTRFLEAVIDSAQNLLVVTAGIQPSLVGWKERGIIQDSAWDRICQVHVQLLKMSPAQARLLLEVRLRKFFEPFEEVPELRQRVFEDSLFPLGTRWFQYHVGAAVEVRPREVLNAAREAWHREQHWLRQSGGAGWLAGWKERLAGPEAFLPPVSLSELELNEIIDRKVQQQMEEHATALRGQPPDRESLAEAVAQLVEERRRLEPGSALLRVLRPDQVSGGNPSPYHLFLEHRCADGSEARTGVVLVHDLSARSLVHVLDRLRDDASPPSRLMLLASESGLSLGERGQEHYDALRQRPSTPLEVVQVAAVELVTLDAMNATWNMARGEDLDVSLPDGRTRSISAEEVIRSHQRQGRFTGSQVLTVTLLPPAATPAAVPVAAPVPEPEPTVAYVPVGASVVDEVVVSGAPVGESVVTGAPDPAPWLADEPVIEAATPVAAPTPEDEVAAMLFEDAPPTAEPAALQNAAAVMVEGEHPILAETEPVAELETEAVAEEEAEAILLADEQEAEAILLEDAPAEEMPVVTEAVEEEAILLSAEPEAEEEAEAVLLADEEEGTLLVEDAPAEGKKDGKTPNLEL